MTAEKANSVSWGPDAALVVTVLIWGINFSVVKACLEYFSPWAFNSLRLLCASAVLLFIARLHPGASVLARDRRRLVVLGVVGHTLYQLCFIHGLNETTASNSAIFLGMTPVFVAVLSRFFVAERLPRLAWTGIAFSIVGVYFVLQDSSALGGTLAGDALVLAATVCWSLYTVLGQPIVARYGLFKTNAYSMAIGTLGFVPFGVPDLMRLGERPIPQIAWAGWAYSFLFALVVAYSFWYFGVSRIGPTQTAIYANVTPVAAIAVAWLWLGEPVGTSQLVGAGTILTGVYLVRRRPARLDPGSQTR
jgi:drug/metabolite transporter (DMT)-like permease